MKVANGKNASPSPCWGVCGCIDQSFGFGLPSNEESSEIYDAISQGRACWLPAGRKLYRKALRDFIKEVVEPEVISWRRPDYEEVKVISKDIFSVRG